MIHCLTSNPVRCSPKVIRSCRDNTGPQVRCHSSRVVPTYRSKTSTDFLIIPERRKADGGIDRRELIKQYSLPGGSAMDMRRCQSSVLPTTQTVSPLLVLHKVDQIESVPRVPPKYVSEAETISEGLSCPRSQKRIVAAAKNPLLDDSPLCAVDDEHASLTSDDTGLIADYEVCSPDSAYDRDDFDVEALFMKMKCASAPAETSTNVAPPAESVFIIDDDEIFSACQSSVPVMAATTTKTKPYTLPKGTFLEPVGVRFPDGEHSPILLHLDIKQQYPEPQQQQQPESLDFSVTFTGPPNAIQSHEVSELGFRASTPLPIPSTKTEGCGQADEAIKWNNIAAEDCGQVRAWVAMRRLPAYWLDIAPPS
eukprot:Gregarina_sp_Poly_1__20@NODE_1004_length_5397_cov_173_232270_g704_i0_p2_GENE_NODE_1004_length_5397_cov_173_232270_g704_i0NODE_1004_length_5397_cov_173_232270_g704_i0_p2_ORF_typecomplete_len367_score39_94_NODE_1004_length_5397_cov_173_232270_g704_i040135113